jgi:hypothetical protein
MRDFDLAYRRFVATVTRTSVSFRTGVMALDAFFALKEGLGSLSALQRFFPGFPQEITT